MPATVARRFPIHAQVSPSTLAAMVVSARPMALRINMRGLNIFALSLRASWPAMLRFWRWPTRTATACVPKRTCTLRDIRVMHGNDEMAQEMNSSFAIEHDWRS